MATATPEDLKKAYGKKYPGAIRRMAAASTACMRGDSIRDAAGRLMRCPGRAPVRVERLGEGGVAAPRDLPRPGRPPEAERSGMAQTTGEASGPGIAAAGPRLGMLQKAGTAFHAACVRELMSRYGLTPRAPAGMHAGSAGGRTADRGDAA